MRAPFKWLWRFTKRERWALELYLVGLMISCVLLIELRIKGGCADDLEALRMENQALKR